MEYTLKYNADFLDSKCFIGTKDEPELYFMDSPVFDLGDRVVIYSHDKSSHDRAVCRIDREYISFPPKFSVHSKLCSVTVEKRNTLFKAGFILSCDTAFYEAEGDFSASNYKITRNGIICASVTDAQETGTLYISIAEGEDDLLLLGIALVVLNCMKGKKR